LAHFTTYTYQDTHANPTLREGSYIEMWGIINVCRHKVCCWFTK